MGLLLPIYQQTGYTIIRSWSIWSVWLPEQSNYQCKCMELHPIAWEWLLLGSIFRDLSLQLILPIQTTRLRTIRFSSKVPSVKAFRITWPRLSIKYQEAGYFFIRFQIICWLSTAFSFITITDRILPHTRKFYSRTLIPLPVTKAPSAKMFFRIANILCVPHSMAYMKSLLRLLITSTTILTNSP